MLCALEGNRGCRREVMAAYRHVYGFGHLGTDCPGPGSAPNPYARNEYGNILALILIIVELHETGN